MNGEGFPKRDNFNFICFTTNMCQHDLGNLTLSDPHKDVTYYNVTQGFKSKTCCLELFALGISLISMFQMHPQCYYFCASIIMRNVQVYHKVRDCISTYYIFLTNQNANKKEMEVA